MRARDPLVLLLAAACGGLAEPPRADLLLVTFDTLRADHTTPYGHGRPTTPALGRLAADGLTFEVAYAPVGATCPSHATLFTSKLPIEHGVERNGLGLAGDQETLAELLGQCGYRTAAFVSSFPVSRRFGFAQGFDHYEDDFALGDNKIDLERWGGEDLEHGFDRSAERTAAAALEWLATAGGAQEPLFVWLHFFDPHAPWSPPRRIARDFPAHAGVPEGAAAAAYEAEIRRADDQLAVVLEALERLRPGRELLTVVTSDHGESLGEHGFTGHNRTMYEPELRIPLVLRGPGVAPGRSARPAHLIDVAPTVVAALGLDVPADWGGLDLLAAEPDAGRERALFMQRPFYPRGRDKYNERGESDGLRVGSWKYLEAPAEGRRELYDLAADPDEAQNLQAREPERAAELAQRLHEWVAGQRSRAGTPLGERAEDADALRALGYAGDGD